MLGRLSFATPLLGAGFAGLLLLGLPEAEAQTAAREGMGAVSGRVTLGDGRPAAGASVRLLGEGAALAADADGRFRFVGAAAGVRTLRAELPGFGRAERSVLVRPGQSLDVELSLPFLPFSEAVTVTATRSKRKLSDSPVNSTVLNRVDLERWPAPTLDEALKQVPSFSLFRRTSSLVSHPTTQGVSLRGVGASGASRTLVLVDGVPQNDAFGNWVYWDSLPQVQIESIEVAPGGLSSLYGSSAMAGVITIATRRPTSRDATFQGSGGNRGSWDSQLFASDRWGPVTSAVGGKYFRTDGYTLVDPSERGPVDVAAASRHRSGSWRLEYALSPSVSAFQNGRIFAEDRENGTPLQTNASRETFLSGGLRGSGASGGSWQLVGYTHLNDFDSTFSAVGAGRASENLTLDQTVDYKDAGGSLVWTRPMGASHVFGAGGDLRYVEADNFEEVFIAPALNVRDRSILGKQILLGGYLQDVVSWRRAVLIAGVRFDHWRNYDASQDEIVTATQARTRTPFADAEKTQITPRGGILWRLGGNVALRGSVYGGFRAPSLNELYRPFRVGNVVTQGNPQLGPERLVGGELGFNHDPTPGFSWRATAFWDRVRDPIGNATVSVTPALITRMRQNLGTARVRGVSVEASYEAAPALRVQLAYVLSDARVTKFPTTPAIEGNLLPQVPRHRASLGLDFVHPRTLSASLRARLESRRFDDDQNRLPLRGLFVTDLVLERRLSSAWSAFVSGENLFDRRYPVQATPVELLGTPFTVSAGLRFDLQPR